jgi:hypothetical protein
MEYKDSKAMTIKDPKEFRRGGGRWRGHLRGEKTGRMMWMKTTFPVKRSHQYNKEQLMGLEVDMARLEMEEELTYDELEGGHRSSFALVEEAVKLFGKNPDHYNNASYEEEFQPEKKSTSNKEKK